VLISTKATFPMGDGPNQQGSSRQWLTVAVEASLKRLGTDYIDLFQLHGFDALTPQEETLRCLDDIIRAGKIRYTGGSNFSGWHMMKSLATSDRLGINRHVAHQAYYSLLGRDYEWDLMHLALDQGVGAVVWSPLGWGRLSGKYRRSQPIDATSRAVQNGNSTPPVADELFYDVMDVLDTIAAETGKSVPQIALNWVLGRPSVATVIIGARNAKQLRDNLGAIGWTLTSDQITRLDAVSRTPPPYPNWHQAGFSSRNPAPV
jgi:aryl-alcohol dehydrogenase-like predicted oxidoreductase